MSFVYIQLKYQTVLFDPSGATTPGLSEPRSYGNEGVLNIPQSSSITGAISSDCLVSYLGNLYGKVLLLRRDAVGVFYSPSRLGFSFGESYISAEMQSVYSTALADWTTRWGSLTPLQRCSRCILPPQPTGLLVGGVLLLCRDAVGVFYSLSRLGYSLGESYSSAEMQSVYSTALVDWAIVRKNMQTELSWFIVLKNFRYNILIHKRASVNKLCHSVLWYLGHCLIARLLSRYEFHTSS